MTDRPILFSGPMVRALIDGTKTQTRRIVGFAGADKVSEFVRVGFDRDSAVPFFEMKDAAGNFITRPAGKHFVDYHYSPRFAVGDRLWVREAWRCNGWATDVATIFYRAHERASYTEMCEQFPVAERAHIAPTPTWKPGIHMPRWISRLTLTVTEIRIQRLQEICEADAIAEGLECRRSGEQTGAPTPLWHVGGVFHSLDPRIVYARLWDSLNADRGYGWDANPWVVTVSFTVGRHNIDEARP